MDASIGSQLRAARQERGLSIAHVAEAVRLRPSVIHWLETDDFTPCGPAAYVRGYLRSLASYLDLSADDIVAEYTRQYQPAPPRALPRATTTSRRRGRHHGMPTADHAAAGTEPGAAPPTEASLRPLRNGRKPRGSSRVTRPTDSAAEISDEPSPRDDSIRLSAGRTWLPLVWFVVVMTVVAALGYTLLLHDARARDSVPATTGVRSQPFSPSPAPFTVGRAEHLNPPRVFRA